MPLRDVAILLLCCVAWGGNFVVISWATNLSQVPPMLVVAVRALIVTALMSPFLLRPRPARFWRMMGVALFIGPIHLAFLYSGLSIAPAGASAIVSQMLIPMSTVLAVVFLRESIGWRRSLAIAGAFGGVVVMVYRPGMLAMEVGLLVILAAYLWIAIGSVLMRTLGEMDWRVYVAWTAVLVSAVMVPATLVFESGHLFHIQNNALPLFGAAVYAAILVSIFAHGQYFRLLTRYAVNDVVPLTLMTPLFAVGLSIAFLGESLERQTLIGAALILPCVYVIARRGGPRSRGADAPELALEME